MATKQFIRITARIEGFRRAGLAHPCTPCDYPVEAFTDTQLAQLEAEPNLIVQQVEREVADKGNTKPTDQDTDSGDDKPASQSAGKGNGKPAEGGKKGAAK